MQRRETSSIALAYVMLRRETPSNRALKAWWAGRRGRRRVRRVEEYHLRPVRVHAVSAYSGTTTPGYRQYQAASVNSSAKGEPACRGRSSGRAATAERAGVLHLLSILSLLYFYSTSTFPVLLPTTYEAEPSRK